jgi:hypothetical protein
VATPPHSPVEPSEGIDSVSRADRQPAGTTGPS